MSRPTDWSPFAWAGVIIAVITAVVLILAGHEGWVLALLFFAVVLLA